MLQELLSTPVTSIDPNANPIDVSQPQEIFLDSCRTDMSNDNPDQVFRYSLTFGISSGPYAGRKFFDDVYPRTRAGDPSQYAAKQVGAIIDGTVGRDAVVGRDDIGEVLSEIAGFSPPMTWTQKLKTETKRNGQPAVRLAI